MRRLPRLVLPLLCALAAAEPAAAREAPHAPYHGLWGTSARACRPVEEGVSTLEINPNGLYWYETRCRARTIARAAPRRWRMRLACEGEGARFQAHSRLTLAGRNRLIIEDAPVAPTRRHSYVRCEDR